jgi:hypothetical protein
MNKGAAMTNQAQTSASSGAYYGYESQAPAGAYMVAGDPRGPMRRIVAIVERTDGTAITCDCGHTYDRAQHFTYKIGADIRCIECLSSANGDLT